MLLPTKHAGKSLLVFFCIPVYWLTLIVNGCYLNLHGSKPLISHEPRSSSWMPPTGREVFTVWRLSAGERERIPIETRRAKLGDTNILDLIWVDLTCLELCGLSAHPSDHVSAKSPTCFWEPDFPLCPWGNSVAAVEPPGALLWFAGEGEQMLTGAHSFTNKAQFTEHSVPEIARVVGVGLAGLSARGGSERDSWGNGSSLRGLT